MPYATTRREQLSKRCGRFAHYTSAENTLWIIQSQAFWLRNATCMTDYTEVQLGHRLLVEYFSREENRKSFYTAVSLCGEGVAEEPVMLFDDWWKNNIRFNTFIGCMSEHDDGEDVHRRLPCGGLSDALVRGPRSF